MVECSAMSDKHRPHDGPTLHDPNLEYQEDQECKRLGFEAEQEHKRQEFEERLEKQKAKRDWMMLIITFAAVAAAYWTGWEARHARLEATDVGKQSIEKQQAAIDAQTKSVDAQIQAMQLEQRPYVSLRAKVSSSGNTSSMFVSPEVSGRTPALNLTLIGDRRLEDESAQAFIADLRRRQKNKGDFRSFPQSVLYIPIANPGQQLPSYLLGVFPADPRYTQKLSGIVIYTDLFNKEHYMKFCFQYLRGLFSLPGEPVQCDAFAPEIN
jgi:hypothetical protein